jgi:hypothetical protein
MEQPADVAADSVDLTTLVLEESTQLEALLTVADLAGLTCTSASMALAVPTKSAAAVVAADGDDALPTPPFQARGAPASAPGTADTELNHAGDPFVYAEAAAARAAPARLERRLPLCTWLPQGGTAATTPSLLETVALASYPRSGNSMLRGLLERRYGFYTGSDTRPDRTLSR